jgi:photosystem II stability/assembly factor-like uncharacterized protein
MKLQLFSSSYLKVGFELLIVVSSLCGSIKPAFSQTITLPWEKVFVNYEMTSICSTRGLMFLANRKQEIYQSADSGRTWTILNQMTFCTEIRYLNYFNNQLFASTDSGLFLSTDSGKNWHIQSVFDSPSKPEYKGVYQLIRANDRLFIGTYNGIYQSLDSGVTWLSYGLQGNQVQYLESRNADTVYCSDRTDTIFYTTNKGKDWKEFVPFQGYSDNTSLFLHGNHLFIGFQGIGIFRDFYPDNTGVLKNNFTPVVTKFISSGNAILANGIFEIYYSVNQGDVWNKLITPDSTVGCNMLDLQNGYCFAGLVNGSLYRCTMSDDVLSVNRNIFSSSYCVHPNPTHENITICRKTNKINTAIQLLNSLGSQVPVDPQNITINNEEAITLNLSMLSPGIYFLRIASGEAVNIQKVIKY